MPRNPEETSAFITLTNEVINQCSFENFSVPPDLCAYLVDLKILQSCGNVSLTRHDSTSTENLVEMCVKDLKEDSLSVKTMKLQLFWLKKYQSRDEIKKIHHERVFKNVIPLMSEILEDAQVKPLDKDHVYKKIVFFIVMFAGLGSPSQQTIINEAQGALHSIFKATEVENFISLPKATKEQQLIEFARLITGIMLFNKDCKKGGEGMDDLPLILTEGVRATKERLLGFKDQLDQRIDQLANPLLQCCVEKHREDLEEKMTSAEDGNTICISAASQQDEFEELKRMLIHCRQIEFCLNDLIKDLEKSFGVVEDLVERLQSALLQVHNVVRYRVAVATVQVFPLFVQLSNVWVEMQEEVDILSEINNNFVDLSMAAKTAFSVSLELPSASEPAAPLSTDEILQCPDFYPGVTVCSILSVSNQEHLQYKGFCGWTLAHTDGLLITGNIRLGVLHFSNRFYTFSSAEAAYKWALDPNHYIKTALTVAKRRPELIKFLNLEEDLLEKLAVEEEEKPAIANAEIQTDVHPIESFIDREYTFSEWEMKRRVMKLATLTKCVTRSQQTVKQSCFRTEMGVQVTPSRSVATQTAKDGFFNHPAVPRSAWTLRQFPSGSVPRSKCSCTCIPRV